MSYLDRDLSRPDLTVTSEGVDYSNARALSVPKLSRLSRERLLDLTAFAPESFWRDKLGHGSRWYESRAVNLAAMVAIMTVMASILPAVAAGFSWASGDPHPLSAALAVGVVEVVGGGVLVLSSIGS